MMSAYLNIRNKVNAYDFLKQSSDAMDGSNKIKKLQYKPDYSFNMDFSKTFIDPIEYHLYVVSNEKLNELKLNFEKFSFHYHLMHRQFINRKKSFVDQLIRKKALIENTILFMRVFIELYIAIYDLCSFEQQKKSVLFSNNK